MKRTILIADDDEDFVDLMVRRARIAGYEVLVASSGVEAVHMADKHRPDAVILDETMPEGSGLAAAALMSTSAVLRGLPIIILTGSRDEGLIRRCHDLCSYYVPKFDDPWAHVKPVLEQHFRQDVRPRGGSCTRASTNDLLDAAFALIGDCDDHPFAKADDRDVNTHHLPWILSIEDDLDFSAVLASHVQRWGYEVVRAADAKAGCQIAFDRSPKAILLDYELPDETGAHVLQRLKHTPSTCRIPVIALSSSPSVAVKRRMRSLGAEAFLCKPVRWHELRAVLRERAPTSLVAAASRG